MLSNSSNSAVWLLSSYGSEVFRSSLSSSVDAIGFGSAIGNVFILPQLYHWCVFLYIVLGWSELLSELLSELFS